MHVIADLPHERESLGMRLAQLLPANIIRSYMGGNGLQCEETVVQLYPKPFQINVGRTRLVQGSKLSVQGFYRRLWT